MTRATTEHRIFAVVLAAGESRRFGSAKQLARLGDVTLVARAAKNARSICGDHSMLVVGRRATDVSDSAGGFCQFLIMNERFDRGIGSSIALAAHALGDTADAILLLLADQPLITVDHLEALLERWSGNFGEIVTTSFEDAQGPPVLLPSGTFADLQALTGDRGARSLFSDDRFQLKTVRFDPAGVDIDTHADLERAELKYIRQAAE